MKIYTIQRPSDFKVDNIQNLSEISLNNGSAEFPKISGQTSKDSDSWIFATTDANYPVVILRLSGTGGPAPTPQPTPSPTPKPTTPPSPTPTTPPTPRTDPAAKTVTAAPERKAIFDPIREKVKTMIGASQKVVFASTTIIRVAGEFGTISGQPIDRKSVV